VKHLIRGAFLAALLACGASARAQAPGAEAAFAAIVADFETYERANDPVTAGSEGDLAALARLPDPSPAADARRKASLAALRDRLAAIDAAALATASALNRDFLARIVDDRLQSIAFDEARAPFRNDSGFWTLPAYLATTTRARTAAEAEAWIARLDATPAYLDAQTANMRRGMASRVMQPRVVVEAALTSLQATPANADESPLMAPFASLSAAVPAAQADALRARARAIINDKVLPAQRELRTFMETEYLPRAPTRLAVRDQPGGADYYRWLIREHTTTNLTPDEVHALGLREVARIRARMDEVIRQSGYQGSFADFLRMLRTDPRFYAQSPEELLMRASEIAKRADDRLPGLFRTLPRLSYGVRPVPADIAPAYTTGRYFSGSPEQGVAGGLMINTTKLDQRPLYELPALALHEGAPGHHIQIALAQERTDLPWFRRNAEVTAFTEGWGLYAEYLGEEMGMYRDPYEQFGRLSYEMWRACRLVADTGIHWKRWTMAQARQCFDENSALSPHNITTELERYVSWPGQADAYKIGEIEFRRLRAKAETALGTRFDVRDFHDAVLREGPLPLDLLDRKIDAWIVSQQR
jgi:uncharacterized protein (DUF885 family)